MRVRPNSSKLFEIHQNSTESFKNTYTIFRLTVCVIDGAKIKKN